MSKVRALVTGADGFIGSHLTELLVLSGYKVKALSQYNSFNSWGWLEDINCKDQIEILAGDIRDSDYCKYISKDVDIIFHLAALIAIPYSYVAPDSYVDTNIKGTLNICQAAKENGNVRVIHTSTSEVYGDPSIHPQTEDYWGNVNPIGPRSCYDEGKRCAETLFFDYHRQHHVDIRVVRIFNTYGPRQSARAVIPTIITQLLQKKNVIKLKVGK